MKVYLLCFLIYSFSSWGYVISRTETGAEIKWNQSDVNLYLNLNPYPVSDDIELDIGESDIDGLGLTTNEYLGFRTQEIITESVAEWNEISPYQIVPITGSGGVNLGDSVNSFAYTNNFEFFSSGVLAITSISYSTDNGKINAADLLINQSFSNSIDFTLDPTESSQTQAYLGDIITHELGHFLGLGHSEVVNASMMYSVFKNQSSIHADDAHGVQYNYKDFSEEGEITGTVVSDSGAGILGAHVQLISVDDNSVVQGTLSDQNGDFTFYNVDRSVSYNVLVSPIKNVASLPEYWKYIKTDYCAGKDFVPGFFMTCGPRGRSRPQLIYLEEEADIDLGEVTVRCDENLDREYFALKIDDFSGGTFELNNIYGESSVNFLGNFLSSEVDEGFAGNGDQFSLDFSTIDPGDLDLSQLSLKLSVMTSGIGSTFQPYVLIRRIDDSSVGTMYVGGQDETEKTLTDLTVDLTLSSSASDNIYEVTVFPSELSSDEQFEIFSAPSVIPHDKNLYYLTAVVGQNSGSSFLPLDQPQTYPLEDNSSCREGTLAYSADVYTPLSSARLNAASQDQEEDPFGCGTIDFEDDGGNGPVSFLLGLLGIALLLSFRDYFLSKS